MKNKIIPLLVVGTALISACNQQAGTSSTPAVAKEDAIAEVNGVYIAKATLTELEKEIAERSHGQKFPKEKFSGRQSWKLYLIIHNPGFMRMEKTLRAQLGEFNGL